MEKDMDWDGDLDSDVGFGCGIWMRNVDMNSVGNLGLRNRLTNFGLRI